jgi:hypothetical protein
LLFISCTALSISEGSCTYIILEKHVSRVFEDLQKTKAPTVTPLSINLI